MIVQLLTIAMASTARQTATPLSSTPRTTVRGGAGHYDFMNIDPDNRLVLACHPGKKAITVMDLNTGQAKDVDAGVACNGIGLDSVGHRAFAAGPGNTLVRFDTSSWTKTGTLALGGPGDCVQFDSKRGLVYVDNDDGTNLWIVDPSSMKLLDTIAIKEAPEYMEFDRGRDKIFQAIKSTSTVQEIDAATRKVVAEWTLGDLKSPHGLALDRRLGELFVVGKNGKLVVLEASGGKLLRTLDVVKNSDQIAYDSGLRRLYIPGEGKIQVVQIEKGSERILGDVPVEADCHRVAVDPKTHDVWVAYSTTHGSWIQKFEAR